MGLARLTEVGKRPDTVYVNPDHVITLREISGGTQIKLSDQSTIIVNEVINIVVATLRGAQT